MLGVMLGCTGITQLICPAIGYTSDRSTSRYGRRRPTMVAGALIACLGHSAMLACHHYRVGHLYLVSLTVAVFDRYEAEAGGHPGFDVRIVISTAIGKYSDCLCG